jgi:predicted enzyme related to lactoylglutathione lyase
MLAAAPVAPMLPVVDMDRARQFYEVTLGLTLLEDLSSQDSIAYECGQGSILVLYWRPTPTQADHTAAAWRVDDIEDAVRRLTAQGIQFEQYDFPGLKTNRQGIARLGNEYAAWFKDTEGNILGIFQMG